ncbi:protein kinase [bacterium]|nr:protein kinase [bacterium]
MYEKGDLIDERYLVFDVRRGGMGIVYLCEDTRAGGRPVRVAAKTLLPELHKVPGASARFYNEAILWVELGKHPNILQALYVKRIGGFPFIFMEFVEGAKDRGVDLSSWIRGGALPVTVALNFALQFCNGMVRAQRFFEARGLRFAHRDVKPQNILVNHRLRVKITDFGLSKAMPDGQGDALDRTRFQRISSDSDLSQAGTIVGTPRYMAPEQWRDSSEADLRSDVYSFGCVLHEVLTGKPLFRGDKLRDIKAAHFTGIPAPPSETVSDIPPRLDRIVLKCVRKEPEARYADFAELFGALAEVFREVGGDVSWTDPGALRADPESADELLNKSLSLFELGRKEDGVRLFARAIGEDRRSPAPGAAASGRPRRLVKRTTIDDPVEALPERSPRRSAPAVKPDDPTMIPPDAAPTMMPNADVALPGRPPSSAPGRPGTSVRRALKDPDPL